MIKPITNIDFTYTGELVVDEQTISNVKELWNDFIKDKDPSQFYDGDIYCVTEINENPLSLSISKTKYSCLIYGKKTNSLIVRSLFSAAYIKTSDNYICVILNNKNIINTIGGMASNEDIINNKFDYYKCLVRETKEELGIDLDTNDRFKTTLKYLKYPTGEDLNKSFYPVGTLYEITTSYSKDELISLFNNLEHEDEVEELLFYNKDNYKDLYNYPKITDYMNELFKELFE